MKIRPPAPAMVELFGRLLPATGGEGRKMFGCPCAFLGGNMFMGLYEDRLFLRLAERDRAELLAVEGAEPFAPMGHPMREYVVVPAAWMEGDADGELHTFAAKAACYGKSLPPKARKRPMTKRG
jgi:hypothetical protein